MKIFIIDDLFDKINLELGMDFIKCMTECGHTVQHVYSPEAAIEILKNDKSFDLVALDYWFGSIIPTADYWIKKILEVAPEYEDKIYIWSSWSDVSQKFKHFVKKRDLLSMLNNFNTNGG